MNASSIQALSSRRRFLRELTAAMAVAASVGYVRGKPAQPTRHWPELGFNLYGMKNVPLPEAIDACAAIGYRQVELALMPGFPSEPAVFSPALRRAVRDRLQATGVKLSALLLNLGQVEGVPAQQETVLTAGRLAGEFADGGIPLVETIAISPAGRWEHVRDDVAKAVLAWAQAAEKTGVMLCLKAHAGQMVNSPERLLWIYRTVAHPHLALTYDHSHYAAEGIGLEESLDAVLPLARFIVVKDAMPGVLPPRYLLAGEGSTDYPGYFRRLDQAGYRGPLMVEVSAQIHNRTGYDPIDAAKRCFAALSPAIRDLHLGETRSEATTPSA